MLLTSLSDSDDVVACEDRWQAVGLDRSRHFVSTELDVAQHDWMESGILELETNVSWTLLSQNERHAYPLHRLDFTLGLEGHGNLDKPGETVSVKRLIDIIWKLTC